jgi:hypothetical protein
MSKKDWSERRTSPEFTLYGDLAGMTVAGLKAMLAEYPDDARIDVRSEKVYQQGGWSDTDRDFFVITWDE